MNDPWKDIPDAPTDPKHRDWVEQFAKTVLGIQGGSPYPTPRIYEQTLAGLRAIGFIPPAPGKDWADKKTAEAFELFQTCDLEKYHRGLAVMFRDIDAAAVERAKLHFQRLWTVTNCLKEFLNVPERK